MLDRLLLVIFLSIIFIGKSQTDTLEKQRGYLKFVYENDVFLQTDKYYTQGVFFEYANQLVQKIPLHYLLFRAKNWDVIENKISIRQKCYTPTNITFSQISIGDRPYAGILEMEQSKEVYKLKNKITSAISVGIMGPCAICEEEQKFIHKLTNNAEPKGWKNQISTAPILNYKLNYNRKLIHSRYFMNEIILGSNIGSLLNACNIETRITIGKGFYSNEKNDLIQKKVRFKLFITTQHAASYIIYNSLLQGSFLNNNPYSLSSKEIERIVISNLINLNFGYKKLLFSFGFAFLNKEIKQGTKHAWGNIGITLLK